MVVRHMFGSVPTRVQGWKVGSGRGAGTPGPYFGVGKHKKNMF